MPKRKISIEDAIKEVERELKMRKILYPKWIASGKLHKDRANKQYLALKKALELLQQGSNTVSPKVVQRKLF